LNPFNYVKSVYTKDKSVTQVKDQWVSIYLNKSLVQDKDNANVIARVADYSFYISPTNYFYLLYILIPKKMHYYINSVKKEESIEDVLVDKIKNVLGWSNREYELNKREVFKVLLSNRDYWNLELGVEEKKRKSK
jgi:hypothetical protein